MIEKGEGVKDRVRPLGIVDAGLRDFDWRKRSGGEGPAKRRRAHSGNFVCVLDRRRRHHALRHPSS